MTKAKQWLASARSFFFNSTGYKDQSELDQQNLYMTLVQSNLYEKLEERMFSTPNIDWVGMLELTKIIFNERNPILRRRTVL